MKFKNRVKTLAQTLAQTLANSLANSLAKTLALLLFIACSAFSVAQAQDACIEDYLVSQRPVANHLSTDDLNQLQLFAAKGDAEAGWQFLASLGDVYAKSAADVLGHSSVKKPSLYAKLFRVHMELTTSRKIFQEQEAPFAAQHFRQYVEILNHGVWPDSDQIMNSYLTAARHLGLPEDTVLVAVWTATGLNQFEHWQDKVFSSQRERVVLPSHACRHVRFARANWLLLQDIVRLIF